MWFHSIPRVCLALLALSLSATANVFTVGGAGATHASVQDAVNASQAGDVVLVRAAFNQSVVVNGKSVAIVADAPGRLTWTGSLHVQNVPLGATVLISGFALGLSSFQPVVISQNVGAVRFQDCSVLPIGVALAPSPIGVTITTSADVAILRCDLYGGTATSTNGGSGAMSIDGSTVAICGSNVHGGNGRAGSFDFSSGHASSGSSGYTAIAASASTLVFESSFVNGGNGGVGFNGVCGSLPTTQGGPGAPALVLSSGATARAIGGRTLGGRGGLGGVNTCAQSPDGAHGVAVSAPVGAWSSILAPNRAFNAPRIVREGAPLTLDFNGAPDERVYLAVSPATAYLDSAELGGVVLVQAPFRRVGYGPLNALGTLSLAPTTPNLPAGATNDFLHMQPVMQDAFGGLHVGCAAIVVRVDSTL